MGARHERAIFTVMVPAAKSGVLAGIVLGIGRAIGETMAVIMVAGNQPRLTGSMLKGIRTMTANIVLEMGYATGLHREGAYCDRRCAVRIHSAYQSGILGSQKEEESMTREAVSAAKPAVRVQAKTGKVHGAASAAVLKGLVYGAAMLTFAVLLFLLGYILVTGIPHLKPSLFQWNYTSENVSMMPAILATVETTALALLLAVPLGLFTAVYLNEYAKRGNKLVNVIRITTETLSGIPSIVYGLFGMLFFVTRLHWDTRCWPVR